MYSPLEQFSILPINILITFQGWDFSLTYYTSFFFILGMFLYFLFILAFLRYSAFNLIPNNMQLFIESIWLVVLDSLKKAKGTISSLIFMPYVFTIFLFILVANLIGLLPYGYTLTSHIVSTGYLAVSVFLGANYIDWSLKGEKMFSKFFILKDSLILSILLLPLELISFFFRPIALACRLFSNMVAGHALLKIVENFSWSFLKKGGILIIPHLLGLPLLFFFIVLESAVSFIQTFIFLIMIAVLL